MAVEIAPKSVDRLRRVLPLCLSCGESYKFEPLKHDPFVRHCRCRRCGAGVELPDYEMVDRRRTDAAGPQVQRRLSDRRVASPCRRCGHDDVRGWLATGDELWVKCERCSQVAPAEDTPDNP